MRNWPNRWGRARNHGVIVAAFALLVSCSGESGPSNQSRSSATTGAAAPGAAPIIVGDARQIDSVLSGYQGRWVLVNVWATWCRPCVAETPDLVALHQSLQGRPFAMLGVSADFMTSPSAEEALKKVRAFGNQYKVAYPNVIFSGSTDQLTARFSLSGTIPATILYDPQGREVERWTGRLVEDDLSRIKAKVS